MKALTLIILGLSIGTALFFAGLYVLPHIADYATLAKIWLNNLIG